MAEVGSVRSGSAELCVDAPLRLAEHAHYVRIDDQVVVADMRTGHYLGLDGVGARVWDLIDMGASGRAIAASLFDEFEVSKTLLERDLQALLQDLLRRRLIEYRSPTGHGHRRT